MNSDDAENCGVTAVQILSATEFLLPWLFELNEVRISTNTCWPWAEFAFVIYAFRSHLKAYSECVLEK